MIEMYIISGKSDANAIPFSIISRWVSHQAIPPHLIGNVPLDVADIAPGGLPLFLRSATKNDSVAARYRSSLV